MSRLKQLGILAAITFLLVIALIGTVISANAQSTPSGQTSQPVWSQVIDPPAAEYDLRSVFMAGPNDAWVVGGRYGKGGIILKYELINGVWTIASRRDYPVPLNEVVVLSDRELWAVGDVETLLRLRTDGRNIVEIEDFGSKLPLPQARPKADLQAIQMLGNGEEGWAGGFWTVPSTGAEPYPMLLHYKNGVWNVEPLIGNGAIYSLHFAQGGGWVAGPFGMWRYSGGEWAREELPVPCTNTTCYEGLMSVRALSGEEAWAVGSRSGICAICVSAPYIIHRTSGGWRVVVPDMPVANLNLPPQTAAFLSDVYFTDEEFGMAVGHYRDNVHAQGPDDIRRPMAFSYRDGAWSNESMPPDARGELWDASLADPAHGLAVGTNGLILSYGYGVQPSSTPLPFMTATLTPVVGSTPQPGQTPQPSRYPTAPVPDPKDPNVTYFQPVGHTLRGSFRDYWQRNGGLAQFGYPITEEFREVSPTDGKTYTVQYFERARFEYHPENRPPHDVLLGLLGRTVTAGRENEQPFRPTEPLNAPGTLYFTETGHNMAREFAGYWQEHGGLPVYGYPISEPFTELSPTDGKPYLVQYFERNRFEWHPELPDPYKVSLGLLGVQVVYGTR